MNSVQTTRRRSAVLLVLAILTFACSFFIYGEGETGVRFFMWRDQPLLAVTLLVVSAVFWWFWWRGARSKSS